jgi:hypothetical protein
LLEKFEKARWIKIVIVLAILTLSAVFTKTIVLRTAPLNASYRVFGDEMEVYISNESENDDYETVDLKVKPDFPDDFVSLPEQLTHIPGVSFADAMPSIMNGKGESILATIDTSGNETGAINNFLRFRCDRLPARTFLRFRMKLVRPVKNTTEPITDGVRTVSVEGKFKGRFHIFEINTIAMPLPR